MLAMAARKWLLHVTWRLMRPPDLLAKMYIIAIRSHMALMSHLTAISKLNADRSCLLPSQAQDDEPLEREAFTVCVRACRGEAVRFSREKTKNSSPFELRILKTTPNHQRNPRAPSSTPSL